MDPVTIGILAGAGMGLVKGMSDKDRERKDRRVAAETAMWSPWTGMQPDKVQSADVMGSTMQGGLAGASVGQSVARNDAYSDYLSKISPQEATAPAAGLVGPPAPGAVAPPPPPASTDFSLSGPYSEDDPRSVNWSGGYYVTGDKRDVYMPQQSPWLGAGMTQRGYTSGAR